MIPAEFEYTRPGSVDEAVRALAGGGEDAKVIAGGQSLLPLLRLRLAYPELLVDIGGVDELRGVRDEGEALWIGALTTHDEVVRDALVAEHCGLLPRRPPRWPTRRSGTAARSAGRWPTPTRPVTSPRSRWRWTRS